MVVAASRLVLCRLLNYIYRIGGTDGLTIAPNVGTFEGDLIHEADETVSDPPFPCSSYDAVRTTAGRDCPTPSSNYPPGS